MSPLSPESGVLGHSSCPLLSRAFCKYARGRKSCLKRTFFLSRLCAWPEVIASCWITERNRLHREWNHSLSAITLKTWERRRNLGCLKRSVQPATLHERVIEWLSVSFVSAGQRDSRLHDDGITIELPGALAIGERSSSHLRPFT